MAEKLKSIGILIGGAVAMTLLIAFIVWWGSQVRLIH
jgi:hypothetical protein